MEKLESRLVIMFLSAGYGNKQRLVSATVGLKMEIMMVQASLYLEKGVYL